MPDLQDYVETKHIAEAQAITTHLELLSELQTKYRALQQAQEDSLPPSIKMLLAKRDAEFRPQLEALTKEMEAVVAQIKQATLEHGETVSGFSLQAIYNKPRSNWNHEGLLGYAQADPKILQFYRPGEPTVSIRERSAKR